MEKVRTLRDGIEVQLDEPAPLIMPVLFKRGSNMSIGGGMPMIEQKIEHYVCLSNLPADLQQRIASLVEYLSRP